MEETKEPLIKSANDLKIEITKLNGDKVVDEECCTSIVVMLKNSGEIGTSFLGAHNKVILRAMKRTINKYLKMLNKTLKDAPDEENIVVNKDAAPQDNITEDNNNESAENLEKNKSDKETLSNNSKSIEKTNKSTISKSNTKSKSNAKTKSNTKTKSAEQQSIDEVQEIIKDIKRMQDKYKK